jgi:hypothetical protein
LGFSCNRKLERQLEQLQPQVLERHRSSSMRQERCS